MNTIEMVKAGSAVQDKALTEMLTAIKKGDAKAISKAIKAGSVAAFVVKKGSSIAENAEKYEAAADQVKASETVELPAAVKSSDALAKAEAITRYSSALRRSSALRKLEQQFARLTV